MNQEQRITLDSLSGIKQLYRRLRNYIRFIFIIVI